MMNRHSPFVDRLIAPIRLRAGGLMVLLATLLLCAACSSQRGDRGDLFQMAEQRLEHAIHTAAGYRQIRAAETLGTPQPDFPIDSTDPAVRVGQLRVRVAAGQTDRATEILRIALDPDAPGHVHAIEAAAKLKLSLTPAQQTALRDMAGDAESFATGYILWLLAENDDPDAHAAITDILTNQRPGNRLTAAYAAGFLSHLPPDRHAALHHMAADTDPLAAAFAILALARHQAVQPTEIRSQLQNLPPDADPKAARFLLTALGEVGTASDLPRLRPYLHSDDPELANAAAGAILAIQKNAP